MSDPVLRQLLAAIVQRLTIIAWCFAILTILIAVFLFFLANSCALPGLHLFICPSR